MRTAGCAVLTDYSNMVVGDLGQSGTELGDDLYAEVLETFQDDAMQQVQRAEGQLQDAVRGVPEADDVCRRAMHSFKSTSLTVGAAPLADAARHAEACPALELAQAVARVRAELQRLLVG